MAGPWRFSLVCPKGHHVTEEGYEEDDVRAALKGGGALRLYCPDCEEHWDATEEQLAKLRWALGVS